VGTTDGARYDAFYYAHGCGTPYQRDQQWLGFFASVAEHIVADIGPASVLDVGCAMGFLVEALRQRGVDAYGIDISEYAIANVDPAVAAYCRVAPATRPFGRTFDLVTCIEVLEHMSAAEADDAVANMVASTEDVLFSSTPFDYAELTHRNVQPPEYWAAMFARHGFARDVGFDASFVAPWTQRFRRLRAPWPRAVEEYERRLWQLDQERQARRELAISLRDELAGRDTELVRAQAEVERMVQERDAAAERLRKSVHEAQVLTAQVRAWENRWRALESSMAWSLVARLQGVRAALAPPGSRRERWLVSAFWWYQLAQRRGPGAAGRQALRSGTRRARLALGVLVGAPASAYRVAPVETRPPPAPRAATVDVIVCAHDAPDVTRACLESLARHCSPPSNVILVDDGSAPETAAILREFADRTGADLIVNQAAGGYTAAANQGLKASSADYALLLNSDTLVTPGWLDRMVACAESDERIGVVGPLSNTASWQSVPEVFDDGDWATNPLPADLSVDEMGQMVARYSSRLYPELPFLNGFCLLIKRALREAVGAFDEESFGAGYGEENDFALRARAAGWRLAVADDVYVWHAQSKSYSNEQRASLVPAADAALVRKHGQAAVEEGVAACRYDRVLEGLRARARSTPERARLVAGGRAAHAGRRLLFVLPVRSPGGGANRVIAEARAMRAMGVEVTLFNLDRFRDSFEESYPRLDVPVVYGDYDNVPGSLARLAGDFDAMVATLYASVGALQEVQRGPGGNRLAYGYYIQDFEPYFFEPGGDDFHRAWQSYRLMPDLVRFTKTEWNRREIQTLVGVDTVLVGPSLDVDLFLPRPRPGPEPPERPVRVAAMIRPETKYRAPQLTMEVLAAASAQFGPGLEVVLFGVEGSDPAFRAMQRGFPHRLAGVLGPRRMARLLNDVDVFVDFSSHQAMGLTALEAMACGAAVAVPDRGGASSFARHGQNALLVDTTLPEACRSALETLVANGELRRDLQARAVRDAAACYPERPALRILEALFGGRQSQS
jgi:GT2 family glycosyltransferase/SAM-dependent methyltransferase